MTKGSLDGPCPRDDSGLGWVQIKRKSLLWKGGDRGIFNHHTRRTHDTSPPSNRMDNCQRTVEHPSDGMGSEHGNISKDTWSPSGGDPNLLSVGIQEQ